MKRRPEAKTSALEMQLLFAPGKSSRQIENRDAKIDNHIWNP